MIDSLMTVEEVAGYLGVAVSTVYGWVSMAKKGDGKVLEASGRPPIPVIKVGRLDRFRKKDIDEWLEECAQVERRAR